MKKGRIAIVAALAVAALAVAPSAMAKTQIVKGSSPLTNLAPAGADIHLGLTNFPKGKGIYIFEVVKPKAGAQPTIINPAAQVWVVDSKTPTQGATSLYGDIKIHVTSSFAGHVCKNDCGLYFEYDHNNATNRSEDAYYPITFAKK